MQGMERVKLQLAGLHLNGIELVSARTQNSIGVMFFCRSLRAVQLFQRRLTTGCLKETLETIFNELLVLMADHRDTIELKIVDIICDQDAIAGYYISFYVFISSRKNLTYEKCPSTGRD